MFGVGGLGDGDRYWGGGEFGGIGIGGIVERWMRVVYDVMESVVVKGGDWDMKWLYGKVGVESVGERGGEYVVCIIVGEKGEVGEVVVR